MNKNIWRKKALTGLLLFIFVFSLSGCTKGGTSAAKNAYKPETIVYWSVWNDEDSLQPLFEAYRKKHPNVTIEYRKLTYDEYENALLEAFADGRGPDVFSIHNSWLERYKQRILPLPSQTVLPIKYMTGTIKKEEVTELIPRKSLTPMDVKAKFLDVVAADVIMNFNSGTDARPNYVERVYGLPLSMDTLVLFYNKDLLNNVGIVEPPKSWDEFRDQAEKITRIDAASGNILISGAALGTAENIPRNFDILSILMMQNLAPMVDGSGYAAFNKMPAGSTGDQLPAAGALEYYIQFASPSFRNYSWNADLPDAFTMFKDGKLGFFLGYSYQRDMINAQAPKLNYGIAPLPQISEGQIANYASYWVETVYNKTKIKDYAWDFVEFMASDIDKTDPKVQPFQVEKFLWPNKKATALKNTKLINAQLADEQISVFADQLLTAKDWFRGLNPGGAETAFADMIDQALTGGDELQRILNQGAEKVNSAMRTR